MHHLRPGSGNRSVLFSKLILRFSITAGSLLIIRLFESQLANFIIFSGWKISPHKTGRLVRVVSANYLDIKD